MSRSAYYKAKKRYSKVKDSKIEEHVIHCFKRHKGSYGRIRIKKELERKGICVSESKITRIMKENNLIAKGGRRKRRTAPKKTEEQYIGENIFKEIKNMKIPNVVWSADISEVKCYKGKLYVSGIIDVASRKILAINIAKHQRQELVQDTISMAYNRYTPEEGILFHSDRGCQYTANNTKKLLEQYNLQQSMSRPGTPNDNQPIESFWKSLKSDLKEELAELSYNEARLRILRYIEFEYNADRLHSGLHYITPNEYWEQNL